MPTDRVSITIDIDLPQLKAHEEEQWQQWSIYKLPACVTDVNKKAYTPQVVSLGPYHCQNQNLIPMEKHKDRALKHFLKRSGVTPDECLKSLSGIVRDLMDAYDSLDAEFRENPNAFLELMILDGCFLLEFFHAWRENLQDYAEKDPIFSEHGKLYVTPHIKRDMLMLENQLPMKLLHKLYQLQHIEEDDANQLVFQFFFPNERPATAPSDSLHILDMYRKGMLGPNPGNTKKKGTLEVKADGQQIKICDPIHNYIRKYLCPEKEKEALDDIMRSAVELHEAGIKIKRSGSIRITDITFKEGILRLPMITVDDLTEALFLNLIAYERFHVGAGNQVTDYVFFMDNIIDDALDIRLLHSKDIIQNGIGSDKAAAKMFNSLSKDVVIDKTSPLGKVYKKVNSYCKQKKHKNRADFCHKYCTSPWAGISVIAAILLFALTITQTIFTVLPYFTRKNN